MNNEILQHCIVYDNGGETLDRFTIYTPDGNVYGMSETGAGFDMWIGEHKDINKGRHLGKKLKSVPDSIARSILNRLIETEAQIPIFNGRKRAKKLSKPTDFGNVSKQDRKRFK